MMLSFLRLLATSQQRKNIHEYINDIEIEHDRGEHMIFSAYFVSFAAHDQLSVHCQKLQGEYHRSLVL